jgi:hypothetical protein
MTETIQVGGEILAMIIYANNVQAGNTFISPEHFPLQLGILKGEAGYRVAPHFHRFQERQILNYQEILFIKSGKVKVGLYDNKQALFTSRTLSGGDCILFASGGHSVELLKDSEIFEVKQGPYMGNEDKVFIGTKEENS